MYSAYPAGYAPYTKRWQPCSNLMNYKLKRHKLLKTLAPSSLEMHAKKLGVSFDDIYKILNISESDFHKIASRLYNEDEIKYTNVDHEGVYSTIKGLQSFTDKKYLNEFNQILTSNIKNAVQIIIPVLSLIVAVTVLFLKIDSATLRLKESIDNEYKSEIELLKIQIDSLKLSE